MIVPAAGFGGPSKVRTGITKYGPPDLSYSMTTESPAGRPDRETDRSVVRGSGVGRNDFSKRDMKVAICTSNIDCADIGPAIYRRNLIESMIQLDVPGLEISLVHHEPSDDEIYDRANEIITPQPRRLSKVFNHLLGIDNIPEFGYNPLIEQYLYREFDFDLIHLQTFPFVRPFWVGKGDTKVVATKHFGIRRSLHPDEFGFFDRLYRTKLPRLFADKLDGMLAISEESKRLHSQYYGVDESDIFVTHNAPPKGFEPDRDPSVLDTYDIEQPYAFHLSNRAFYKNPEGIVKGFSEAIRRYDIEHDLVLAGGRWERSDFLKHCNDDAVEERIHFLGRLPRGDMPALYTYADFVFLPSLSEGFPFVLLESMVCGTPVLTTAQFGMPELIGNAGVYISDPTDVEEIALRLSDICGREGLSEKAVDRSQSYSWKNTAEQTVAVYEDLLSGET